MDDVPLHTAATTGTGVLVAGLVLLISRSGSGMTAAPPPLEKMDEIEASIAYKKPNQPKQPQKKLSAPEIVKPEGISHDENKKVEPKKDDPPKKDAKVDDKDPFKNFKHDNDDNEAGKPTQDIGAFDGQDYGTAAETKGDPFYQGLLKDMEWEYPAILKGTETEPVGCLHITADGKIAEVEIHLKSGDDSLDDSVERALKKVKAAREDHPQPVPTYLLKAATTKWVCFKFQLQQK
ncbi:MAG TPA: TonB C-terminal domain-containing protein [Kofleriaceae bacterium]|jgi:outer membrane biosynthesis protein TonB